MREMSSEQKEELTEEGLEPKDSKVTPSRSKEKRSGGMKANRLSFQTKPTEPACHCTPPKKENSPDPIKGNRGKLILLIWSVTLVILWVIIYSILAYFDVV